MPYTTQAKIETAIPAPVLIECLDDDNDGQPDAGVLDEIISVASNAVDALLAGRYSVPFTTPPAIVQEGAFVFSCESIYDRRQVSNDKNPFKSRANKMRELLAKIGAGEQPLDASQPAAYAGRAAITEDAAVNGSFR